MKKENDPHPVYASLHDWSKVRKANHVVAEKHTRKETKNDRT